MSIRTLCILHYDCNVCCNCTVNVCLNIIFMFTTHEWICIVDILMEVNKCMLISRHWWGVIKQCTSTNYMLIFIYLQMMEQLTSFYMKEYPQALRCRGDYNVIGRKLYMWYPSLKWEGKKPWSALTHILSGHIRTKRYV